MIEEHTAGFYTIESFRIKRAYEDTKRALDVAREKYEYDLKLSRLLRMYKSRGADRSMIGARVLLRNRDVEAAESVHVAVVQEYLSATANFNRQSDIVVSQAEDVAYEYVGWSPIKRFLFDVCQKLK